MKVLIVSATRMEIRKFLDLLSFTGNEDEYPARYRYHEIDVDVLVTGIGMTATAYHLGRVLANGSWDLVINAGICGSFSKSLPIGEVVEVTEEVFSGLGAHFANRILTLSDLNLAGANDPPFMEGKLVNPSFAFTGLFQGFRKVRGSTSDTMYDDLNMIKRIIGRFHPDVESMEGASFFYSCLSAGVPFREVRSISNYAGEQDRSKWNIPLAFDNLAIALGSVLDHLR
jgi:futalosine hydrolase